MCAMIFYYEVLATNGKKYSVASLCDNIAAGDVFFVPAPPCGLFFLNDVGEREVLSAAKTFMPKHRVGYDLFHVDGPER